MSANRGNAPKSGGIMRFFTVVSTPKSSESTTPSIDNKPSESTSASVNLFPSQQSSSPMTPGSSIISQNTTPTIGTKRASPESATPSGVSEKKAEKGVHSLYSRTLLNKPAAKSDEGEQSRTTDASPNKRVCSQSESLLKPKESTKVTSPPPAKENVGEDDEDAVSRKGSSASKKSSGRKRVITDDSDESGPDASSSEFSQQSESESSESEDETGFVSSDDDENPRTPNRSKRAAPVKKVTPLSATPKTAAAANKSSTPVSSPEDRSNFDGDDDDDDDESNGEGMNGTGSALNFSEQLPDFVQPQNRKDLQGRRPDHPDYDPRTLYIPSEALRQMTPAQRQYWQMKAENMDVVLFFKIGKFYELFDQDAEVGIKELNLLKMNTERLHVGFPEVAYSKYADILLRRGYRIGRIEQTQTPQQLKDENASLSRGQQKSQVVRREMCAIVTKATVVDPSLMSFESSSQSSINLSPGSPSQNQPKINTGEPSYLFAICDEQCIRTQAEEAIELEHDRIMSEAAAREDADWNGEQKLEGEVSDQHVKLTRSAYIDNDVVIGVCFVDAAVGAFHVGHFFDNKQRTKLRTLMTQLRPAEILTASTGLSTRTQAAIDAEAAPDAIRTSLRKGSDFWSAEYSLNYIRRANYFNHEAVRQADEAAAKAASIPGSSIASHKAATEAALKASENLPQGRWPSILRALKDDFEDLKKKIPEGVSSNSDNEEVLRANRLKGTECLFSSLGAIVSYMQRLLIDRELVSLGNFYLYDPKGQIESSHMILDGQTLQNLEILFNQEGGSEGTLLKHIDHTSTPFGKRLLRTWVARPLGRVAAIERRLDAVEDLMANSEAVNRCRQQLKKLPDLERMLTRVRANGIKKDNAVMFENVGRQKVEIFLKTLSGFELAIKAIGTLRECNFKSQRLRRLVAVNKDLKSSDSMTEDLASSVQTVTWGESDGNGVDNDEESKDDDSTRVADVRRTQFGDALFPQLEELIDEFKYAFDHKEALEKGNIVPKAGVVPDFDEAKQAVAVKERALQSYLQEQKQALRCNSITYYHRARERYQLEIPIDALKKINLPSEYEQMSQTKAVRRFWTPEIKHLMSELDAAIAVRESLLTDVTRQVFNKFGQDYPLWAQALGCIAEVDCLISLSVVSAYQGGSVCRPKFLKLGPTEGPSLEIRDGVHPALAAASPGLPNSRGPTGSKGAVLASAPTFIPNDTDLGTTRSPPRFVLVSGPNMGGKSTLLRQVCVTVIMAQIGCYVPAASCVFSPVDRIFTRVGANDRIMQGQSTFLVELEETATILRHSTSRSLVILDELGRGTSTFDGTAIAHSVIEHLTDKVGCLALFSTHYHMLLEEFRNDPRIAQYHMACKVESRASNTEGSTPEDNVDVTFLYKFIPGVCSKSFGMNVASLAGLPRPLVLRAKGMSELFEKRLAQAHRVEKEENLAKKQLLEDIRDALSKRDFTRLQNLKAQAQAFIASEA